MAMDDEMDLMTPQAASKIPKDQPIKKSSGGSMAIYVRMEFPIFIIIEKPCHEKRS